MNDKLLLIGGGGHCRSVLDSVLSAGSYDEIGIVDSGAVPCRGIDVVGVDDDLPSLFMDGWKYALVTVGSVGETKLRRHLYDLVRKQGFIIPYVADPSAIISADVVIGDGCFVGKRAVVNAGAGLGECCIINTGAIIEHDVKVGAFSHISPGAVLCGHVDVGSDAHIGAGSVVRQGIRIGRHALVGAGSVVVKDIPEGVKAFGNPCRVVG